MSEPRNERQPSREESPVVARTSATTLSPIPRRYAAICISGLLVLMCGLMLLSCAAFAEDYVLRDSMYEAGRPITLMGGLLLSLGLLMTGLLAKRIAPNVRVGLIIAAALIIGLFLSLTSMRYFYSSGYWHVLF